MKNVPKVVTVLMADDDQDDCLLVKEAFHENKFKNDLKFVEDGEALMEYLRQSGRFSDPQAAPRPGLILLDLNMPRKDGREALREIKADDKFKHIPIIILTTSHEQEDIVRSYSVGANSFITKPVTFEGLRNLIGFIGKYWLEIVELPGESANVPTRSK
jgi:CheY-like chemotaxis protein